MCSSTGTARPTVQIDNDRVRVTEWRFAKRGDNTGWHRHEYDYVVILPPFNLPTVPRVWGFWHNQRGLFGWREGLL